MSTNKQQQPKANSYSNEWYQGLIQNQIPANYLAGYQQYAQNFAHQGYLPQGYPQGFSQGYPHGYIPYAQDPYYGQFGMAPPHMISPRYYGDPALMFKQPPKIKYDPKKFGHQNNSYAEQLRPQKLIELDLINESFAPLKPINTEPKKIQKNTVNKSNENLRDSSKNPKLEISKFNQLMAKQDGLIKKQNVTMNKLNETNRANLEKPSKIQTERKPLKIAPVNNKLNSDAYFSLNKGINSGDSSIKTIRSVDSSATLETSPKIDQNLDHLIFKNKNLRIEEQIEQNKKQILFNKHNIENSRSNLDENTRYLPFGEYDESIASVNSDLSKTHNSRHLSPLKNNQFLNKAPNKINHSNSMRSFKKSPQRKYQEKAPSEDFLRTNDYLDVMYKNGPKESKDKKKERMSKKSDYANMVKLRNAKNLKKIQVEKSESIANPNTNSQPNIATGEHRVADVEPNVLNEQSTQSHLTFNEKPTNVRRDLTDTTINNKNDQIETS